MVRCDNNGVYTCLDQQKHQNLDEKRLRIEQKAREINNFANLFITIIKFVWKKQYKFGLTSFLEDILQIC